MSKALYTLVYSAFFYCPATALFFDLSDFFIVVDILYQWNMNGFQIGDLMLYNVI